MKFDSLGRPASILLLLLILLTGLLCIWISLQTFERISSLVNALAPDGKMESFTIQRFRFLSLVLGLFGTGLSAFSILALIYRDKTIAIVLRIQANALKSYQATLAEGRIFTSGLRWRSQPILDRIALLGITLLAILPRLAELNASISHDEAYTYNAFAAGSLWNTISDYHLPNNHVLLSIFINITAKLIGNQPWMIRIPSMIAGILMIPVAFSVARKLYSRDTAILCTAMVAIFPKLIEYSTVARGYILLELIALILLGLGDYVRSTRNRFVWLLLAIFSALGFFSIPVMLFPFGAIFLWLFLSGLFGDISSAYPSRFDFFKHWFWAGMGAALLTVIFYAPILVKDADLFFNNRFVRPLDWNGYLLIILERLLATWGQWTAKLPDWLVVIGAAGFLLSLVFHRQIAKHKVPVQAAFLFWILAVLAIKRPNAEPKVWSFLIVFLLIWIAAGIVEILKKIPFVAQNNLAFRKALLATMLIILLVNSILVAPSIHQKWTRKSGIDITVSYLESQLQEGDLVIVGVTYAPQLLYLFDINNISTEHIRHDGPYQRAFVIISTRAGGTLERVLNKFGPTSPTLDMDSIQLVKKFGAFEIYQAYPSQTFP